MFSLEEMTEEIAINKILLEEIENISISNIEEELNNSISEKKNNNIHQIQIFKPDIKAMESNEIDDFSEDVFKIPKEIIKNPKTKPLLGRKSNRESKFKFNFLFYITHFLLRTFHLRQRRIRTCSQK